MSWSRIARWAIATVMASVVSGQASGWQKNQVNATMCSWQNARAATLRDTVYIDGGYLWWTPGMADGSYGAPTEDNNPLGLIYTLNFSKPFKTSSNTNPSNISEILEVISKAPNGNAANNLAPNFFDGAMLANDDEFFLYGGLLTKTDVFTSQHSDEVLGYELYQYGPHKDTWSKGFLVDSLPDGLTRYLAFGGAANAPSENKAWYFGGMHSRTWSDIYYPTINDSINALVASDTLITLDMTTQQEETWHNVTLPSDIKGRASPELVWVPAGDQGILVALGGVTYPDFNNGNLTSENEAQSKSDSPAFMSTIDIYDIANDKWYKQPTIAGPGQLALGCAVVAVAQDYTSYNIYYYGGYDGLDMTEDFNDDVWILTLPAFMWMKVSSGTGNHGRAGHTCVKPYPDQMVVIGGYPSLKGGSLNCVEGGLLQIFNLTEGKWMDSYDPENWSDYGVPEMIHLMIGGSETGGATLTTPTPTGWATTELAGVFAKSYPTSKLATYYPYTPSANSTRVDISTSSGSPALLAPILGAVLGLVFITSLVVAIMLYRRRKLLRRGDTSANGTDENGNRILLWIRGQDGSKGAPTVTTEDSPSHTDDVESRIGQNAYKPQQEMAQFVVSHEMPDTPLVELMDTSPRAELGDTGLTPIDVINKHSHFAPRTPHSATNPSSLGSKYSVSQGHGSISSQSQAQSRGFSTPAMDAARPDSPALGTVVGPTPTTPQSSHSQPQRPPPGNPRVVSDVSSISQRDQAHLRQISDASISSAAGAAAPTPDIDHARPISPSVPVSPSSADGREAPDYISVGRSLTGNATAASPLRRSIFYESKDDLGEGSSKR
ncbi:hypothetical protein BJ170DRAFT_261256 [Xylariales sp. AK1849]|nr:hypothetical protein BJ170DRAFT_261256 [Xylariales sp. AK1849]